MTDDETILTSFVAGDEELVDTWHVGTVGRGVHRPPIGPTDTEPFAVTDRRVLWYDDELHEVERSAVADIDRDVVERATAPRIVRLGGSLLMVGLIATVATFLLSVLSFPMALVPAGVGLAGFLLSIAVAHTGDRSGTVRTFPYLQIDTSDDLVTVWGDEADLTEIEATLAEE